MVNAADARNPAPRSGIAAAEYRADPFLTLITIGLLLIDLIGLCSLLDREYASAASLGCSAEMASSRITAQSDGL